MEELLNRAASISELAFLRVLQLCHAQISLLMEDLKGHEVQAVLPRSPINGPDLSSLKLGSPPSTGTGTVTAVSAMLEAAMEELFTPYTEGQRYLEREQKSLGELYSSCLVVFTRYHVRSLHTHSSISMLNIRVRKG